MSSTQSLLQPNLHRLISHSLFEPTRLAITRKSRGLAASLLAIPALLGGAMAIVPTEANACGCVSPPEISDSDYFVAQSGEQILFEVGDGLITAHVLIRYSGTPESFAWMVPVPAVPDFDLTPPQVFSMIEKATQPQISTTYSSSCAQQAYVCDYHNACPVKDTNGNQSDWTDEDSVFSESLGDASSEDDAGDSTPDGIDIEKIEQVGDYQAVVFRADEADKAVTWLKDNGFVVNDTMAPYMQPYLDAKMSFVAIKLIPGATSSSIRPLKMIFEASSPMIPLKLTAVAADPHMGVSAYIFGDTAYQPMQQPIVELDEAALDEVDGFTNYPALVSQSIDAVGGAAFVEEYVGALPPLVVDACCSPDRGDWCAIGGDGQCQCPGAEFDGADCADYPDVVKSFELYESLRTKHAFVSRLLTRLSPEEMNFDPVFVPNESAATRRLSLNGTISDIEGCADRVAPQSQEQAAFLRQVGDCAGLYCGQGQCAGTVDEAVGCVCDAGFVARTYTDLDFRTSVTCVPQVGTVDFEADAQLADPCLGVNCGAGTCVNVGGFPACGCAGGTAATYDATTGTTQCKAITAFSGSAGASNFSQQWAQVQTCRPPIPACSEGGWLVEYRVEIPGVACDDWIAPTTTQLTPPPPPNCDASQDASVFSCRTANLGSGSYLGLIGLVGVGLIARVRRRRSVG